MKNEQDQTRSQLALVAALAKNRGELDAATLERLLRLVGALKPVGKPAG
jgi:arginine repressor